MARHSYDPNACSEYQPKFLNYHKTKTENTKNDGFTNPMRKQDIISWSLALGVDALLQKIRCLQKDMLRDTQVSFSNVTFLPSVLQQPSNTVTIFITYVQMKERETLRSLKPLAIHSEIVAQKLLNERCFGAAVEQV